MPIPEVAELKKQYMDEDRERLAEIAAMHTYIMQSIDGRSAHWLNNLGEGFYAKDRMGDEHMGRLVSVTFNIDTFGVQESTEVIKMEENLKYERAGVSQLPPGSLQTYQKVDMYKPTEKYREDEPIGRPDISEEDLKQNQAPQPSQEEEK